MTSCMMHNNTQATPLLLQSLLPVAWLELLPDAAAHRIRPVRV